MKILNYIKSLLIFLSSANKIANDKYKYNLNDDKRLFQELHKLFKSNINQLKTN